MIEINDDDNDNDDSDDEDDDNGDVDGETGCEFGMSILSMDNAAQNWLNLQLKPHASTCTH